MHAINYSFKFLLTHSIVSLLLVSTIFTVFAIFHFVVINDNSLGQMNIGAFILNVIMSVYFGIYFASGLQSLKQNYLWAINLNYRNTSMITYLLALCAVTLIQLPFLLLNVHFSQVSFWCSY